MRERPPTPQQRAHDARERLRTWAPTEVTTANLTRQDLEVCRKLGLAPERYADARGRELRAVLRAEVRRHHHPRRPLRKLRGRALRLRVAFLERYGWTLPDEPPCKLRQHMRRVDPPTPRLRARAAKRYFLKLARASTREQRIHAGNVARTEETP